MNKTFYPLNSPIYQHNTINYLVNLYMSLLKKFVFYATIIFIICFIFNANATSLSQQDASTGLKGILSQATKTAINQLGVSGGFSNNPEIKIGLPGSLDNASKLLKRLGLGNQLTQLESGMNNAAEAAIPEAQQMLLNSIQQMTFKDAKTIVTGDDTSATAYLEKTNRTQLFNKFLPKVKAITDKNALADNYNGLIKKASVFGVTKDNLSIENYVTNKALDGLFKTMGEQESYLRNNPAEAASSMAKKILQIIK